MKKPLSNVVAAWAFCLLGWLAAENAQALPNLKPFTPPGWSTPVVVAISSTGTNNSAGLTSADQLFVDWCVINNGTSGAGAFTVSLYVDGGQVDSWNVGSLPVNNYTFVTGDSIGMLSAGTHRISITADSGNTVQESNETDNSYTNTITISDAFLPAPALSAPANGSTNQSVTPAFGWTPVTGAASYRIFVAAAILDLPTDPAATNGGLSVMTNATTATTGFTMTSPLLPGTTYYWEAQGNSDSQFGHWSATGSFTTAFPTGPGLTIIPTFDSSITSDPQAATIEATILSSIAAYRHYFSDNITAQITYMEMSQGLGENDFSYDTIPYSEYLAALQTHATTTDDAAALAHLPVAAGNPVNGNTLINVKFPLERALGLGGASGGSDATIFLNTSIMNLSGAQTDPSKYSLYSTVCHETDEALGLGSALDEVKTGNASLSDPIFSEDLFRYDGAGNRSFTTDANAASYFSLDGTDLLVQFNQVFDGDLGDWFSFDGGVTPQVQDAFLEPGVFPSLGVELRALDVIGFTLNPGGTTGQTAPILTITESGGNVVLSWPMSAAGYLLESASSVSPPISWQVVATAPTIENNSYVVTLPASGQMQFFRLTQ